MNYRKTAKLPMRKLATVVTCIIALFGTRAEARMYQWSNPTSGVVQLSGAPPAWYRSAGPGPRVLVFDNGQLVDDTAVVVPEGLRLSLRADAFGEAGDALPQAAPEEPPAQEMLRDALASAAHQGVDVSEVTEAFTTGQESEANATQGTVEQTVAELKSLLDAWDSRRLGEMKELLRDTAPTGLSGEPPPGY